MLKTLHPKAPASKLEGLYATAAKICKISYAKPYCIYDEFVLLPRYSAVVLYPLYTFHGDVVNYMMGRDFWEEILGKVALRDPALIREPMRQGLMKLTPRENLESQEGARNSKGDDKRPNKSGPGRHPESKVLGSAQSPGKKTKSPPGPAQRIGSEGEISDGEEDIDEETLNKREAEVLRLLSKRFQGVEDFLGEEALRTAADGKKSRKKDGERKNQKFKPRSKKSQRRSKKSQRRERLKDAKKKASPRLGAKGTE